MTVTNVAAVRAISGLTTSDISDANLTSFISIAYTLVPREIGIKRFEERVNYISAEKGNDIDGSNTIFYTVSFPTGDYNADGALDSNDITVWQLNSDSVRSELTVTDFRSRDGRFMLSSAPSSGVTLYATYLEYPKDIEYDDPKVKLACEQLAAAFAFGRLSARNLKKARFGKIGFDGPLEGREYFMEQHNKTVEKINANMGKIKKADNIV